jgi:hypothetical protein
MSGFDAVLFLLLVMAASGVAGYVLGQRQGRRARRSTLPAKLNGR